MKVVTQPGDTGVEECACDPRKSFYWKGKRGPFCGESNWTQPMYACRFGASKWERWLAERPSLSPREAE